MHRDAVAGETPATTVRFDFYSDNTAGICPEAMAALEQASVGRAASYGHDESTRRVCDRVRELFETDCDVYLVFNGTAANALALAQLCQSFHSVVCHQYAHINTDECGAPELFTGGAKLLTIGGRNGKLDLEQAGAIVARQVDLHSHKPRVISLTQSTEFGTVYSLDEVRRVTEFARRRDLLVHMDGARFANAVAALGCRPRELTDEIGVDVLSFGGTKNGLGAGEIIVFFRRELSAEFEYRAKQAGQLASKMRFLAAPWHALLSNDVWLGNARHANNSARRLAAELEARGGIRPVYPVEANAVFIRLEDSAHQRLEERGWHIGNFFEPGIYRLMCAWSTADETIDTFVSEMVAVLKA